MTIRVDLATGAVVDGARHWPLRLDARTGGAVVTIDGHEVTVAPLRWRHKQHLARWAHVGPEFVTAQRAALAVDDAESLDDAELAVIAAVADFLDGPALPLTPEVLAAVTIEACRATGLAPAAFDDRDALDVELMWRVGAGPTPVSGPDEAPGPSPARSPADPWADATSIRIVADPSSAAPRPTRPDRGQPGGPGDPGDVTVADPPAPAGTSPTAPSPDAGTATPASPTAPPPTASPTASPPPTVPPTAPPDALSPAPSTPMVPVQHGPEVVAGRPRRAAPRYRIAPAQARAETLPASASGPEPAAPAQAAAVPTPATRSCGTAVGPPPDRPTVSTATSGPLIPPAGPPPSRGTATDLDAAPATTFSRLPAAVAEADDADLDALADAVAARLAGQVATAGADLGLIDASTGG